MANDTNTQKGKVLHIAPTPFFADRGCHIRIEGIANSLQQLGYKNLVCTYHHGRNIDGIETSRIGQIKNYTQTAAGPNKYKLLADWKLLWRVIKEIHMHKPTVIHAHLHEGLMIGLVANTLLFWKRTPIVADMQGSLTGELDAHGSFNKLPWLKWPVKLIERGLMWFAKTIICSSEHSLTKFKTEFNLDEDKISLVQDGANLTAPLSANVMNDIKAEFTIPSNKTVVVYSGALLDGKGLNELKQLLLLTKEKSTVHFLIIGYPTENLDVFINQHQLAEQCTLTGQVPFEQLPSLLGVADIAIDPKFNDAGEGSGKMLNYLASGLPVLAFNTRNNKDFLPQGSVRASSVEEMSKQLEYWLTDSSDRKEVGRNNLSHFKQHYSWAKTVEQLAAVYAKFD